MVALPLRPIVDITYNLPGVGLPRAGFDLGLIVGTSSVISTGTRVVVYNSLEEMVDDGFLTNSAEYLAAVRYFGAISNPSQVAIGRRDSGTESVLQAITACRLANLDWYGVYAPGAINSDHTAVAAYIESLNDVYSQYFFQTSDAAVKNGTSGNIFATMKLAGYKRTHGLFATDAHVVAGILGYAMGQVSDFSDSAFTLNMKNIPGATVDDLTSTQVNTILGNYGNVYINRGGAQDIYQDGRNFSGAFFDEIVYLDKLVSDMQVSVANLLFQSPKIPQTEEGMAAIKSVIAQACQNMVDIGFLSPGRWTGPPILNLKTNDMLPSGYLVLSDPISTQDAQDRNDRIAPNIYVPVKLAGAIHSVLIEINVNR